MAITAVGPVSVSPGLPGGMYAALNITAAAVIKAGPGLCIRVVPVIVGSGGALTINDVLTVGGAATANQIISIPNTSMTAGVPLFLEWPCGTGIVVSAVTTGGQFSLSFT
jgi:hypothetical protein